VRRALTEIEPVEVDLGGATGLVLPGDEAPVGAPEPWVALLPALDPTAMGWAGRDWYLGAHAGRLFDTTGNIGPSVWCDGRVVGGWVQRPDGEIAYRLLEDVGRDAKRAVEKQAGRLAGVIGEARFGARGRRRSPLEQELLA
jgi:Winged helix DNA-binding domain